LTRFQVTSPATIYWILANSPQVSLDPHGVLSPAELGKFSAFHFPKRKTEWLLGRWTAKTLVHNLPAYQKYPLDQIEIRNSPLGAPSIHLPGQAASPGCLTISHRENLALCAITSSLELRVGADLEKIEPRTQTFVEDYFTPEEVLLMAHFPPEIKAVAVTLIWSVKESMLKALGVGLRWDTRRVEVRELTGLLNTSQLDNTWQAIQLGEQAAGERDWVGWWLRRDPFILTLAGYSSTQSGIRSARLVETKIFDKRDTRFSSLS
jgi:4'-phosphopantetheinyl transferase